MVFERRVAVRLEFISISRQCSDLEIDFALQGGVITLELAKATLQVSEVGDSI